MSERQTGKGYMVPFAFPQTVYATAFSVRKANGVEATVCVLEVVSGDNPLTRHEAMERAKKFVPPDRTVEGWAVNFVVLKAD